MLHYIISLLLTCNLDNLFAIHDAIIFSFLLTDIDNTTSLIQFVVEIHNDYCSHEVNKVIWGGEPPS